MGNIDARRDWGHAKDYVEAMWRVLQKDKPEDFVIATGVTTTIRDFLVMAFAEMGISIAFKGAGIEEVGYVVSCSNPDFQLDENKIVVAIDPKYFRPTEVELLIGDPSKAQKQLGWKPKYDLKALVHEMIWSDVQIYKDLTVADGIEMY
jgi:GDPmannose 4,6-dehydratase